MTKSNKTRIRMVPSKDPAVILKFLKGDAIWKRCSGGMKVDRSKVEEFIKKSQAVFLVAVEDDRKGLGFVMLNPETSTAVSIHVCLRTVGDKTKRVISLAMQYAKVLMGASEIHAIYPQSYRAVNKLCIFFGFRDAPSIKFLYPTLTPLPEYVFKCLRI